MQTKKKKKIISREADIESFNQFCLKKKDHNNEPFFVMEGTQIVQNYRCQLDTKSVLDSYRLSIK